MTYNHKEVVSVAFYAENRRHIAKINLKRNKPLGGGWFHKSYPMTDPRALVGFTQITAQRRIMLFEPIFKLLD